MMNVMMKNKKFVLLVFILVIGVVFLFVRSKSRKPGVKEIKEVTSSPEVVEEKKEKTASLPEKISEEEQPEEEKIEEKISWDRDPFHSPQIEKVIEKKEEVALVLTGIVYDRKSARANIGDYIVQVGDMVDGWGITSISKNRVALRKGDKEKILRLREE